MSIGSFLTKVLKHQLLTGSLIMVIGSNLYNFSQLIFHFLGARYLGKVLYGDLASVISIIGIVALIQLAIGLTIAKFIAAEKDEKKVAGFVKWLDKKALLISLGTFLIITISAPFWSSFLRLVEPKAIFFAGPILGLFIIVATQRSILQGLLNFKLYVLSLLVEALVKISLTVILLLLGYTIFGALTGYLGGVLLAVIITKGFLLKYLTKSKEVKPDLMKWFKYSLAAFVQGVALTSMYTTDLLLVKHFLSAEQAGIYASLSMLGRIVFFGTTPIVSVMFPLVAKRHTNGEKYYSILYLSLALVFIVSLVLTLFYYLFPQLLIGLLYGTDFLEGASLLWWFAVFMGLLSIAVLLTQFYLSVGKTKVVYPFITTAIAQLLLIWFIHPNLLAVIQLSILCLALLVGSLLIYLFLTARKLKND